MTEGTVESVPLPAEVNAPEEAVGSGSGDRSHRFYWPDLLLRPDRFAASVVPRISTGRLVLVGLIVGFSGTIDQIDFRLLGAGQPFQGDAAAVTESWAYYLGVGLGGAPFAGLFQYWIGGAWYWVRLRLSGARGSINAAARRWNLLSALAGALPLLAILATTIARFDTPSESVADDRLIAMLPLVVIFMSVWVSYRGAHGLFELGRWSSRFWLFAMPLLGYGSIAIGSLFFL